MANKPFKMVSGKVIYLTDEQIETRRIEEIVSVKEIKDRFIRLMGENQERLLRDSDWTQMTDSGLSQADKVKWDNYRQELKQVHTEHPTGRGAVYPDKPSKGRI